MGPPASALTAATNKLGQRPQRRSRPSGVGLLGIDALTHREIEVARLVVDRKTNHEIATELFLSQKTVETHLSNIFNKTGVATRVALARAMEQHDRSASQDPRRPDLRSGAVAPSRAR
jgi:DNA-binding NarL/FixJ family response regulator